MTAEGPFEAEAQTAQEAPEAYSEAWWHARSSEELREAIARGHSIGPAFEGAAAEIERRARENLRAEEEAAVAEAMRLSRLRRLILEAVLLVLLVLVVVLRR
jgi:hypothetical protein